MEIVISVVIGLNFVIAGIVSCIGVFRSFKGGGQEK